MLLAVSVFTFARPSAINTIHQPPCSDNDDDDDNDGYGNVSVDGVATRLEKGDNLY